MVNVDVQQIVLASVSDVSMVLLDHGQLSRFFDAKFRVTQSAEHDALLGGKGCIRKVTIAGVTFSERILSASNAHICYAIIGDRPLRNHQGNIYLSPLSETQTCVRYTITCKAPKWLPDKLVQFLLGQGVKKALSKLSRHYL